MKTENINRAIIQSARIRTEKEYLNGIHYDLLRARDLCLGAMQSSFGGEFEGSVRDGRQAAEDWALTNYTVLNAIVSAVESILDRATMQLDTLKLHMDED